MDEVSVSHLELLKALQFTFSQNSPGSAKRPSHIITFDDYFNFVFLLLNTQNSLTPSRRTHGNYCARFSYVTLMKDKKNYELIKFIRKKERKSTNVAIVRLFPRFQAFCA
jgi:hypothetical protein